MLRLLFLVSFCCCSGNICRAQYVYMKHLTSADGLPSNVVYDVLQDDDGFIWFATDHGVSRFDGKHFVNFLKADGIADDEIIRLGKDHLQRIWFLGFNGKASFYLHGKFYHEGNSAVAAQTQLNSVFCKVLISKKGTVYLVSNSDGFIAVNGDTVERYSKKTLLDLTGFNYLNGLKSVKMDTAGQLLLFTGDSATIFSRGNVTPSPQHYPANIIHGFMLSDGACVILGDNGFVRYNGNKTDTAYGFEQNPLSEYNSVEEDGNNNLWLMSKSGARLFRNKMLDTAHQLKILEGKYCGHVFTDSEGNTWIAPLRDGVYMIPSVDIRFLNLQDGLVNNDAIVLANHPEGAIAGFSNGNIQLIRFPGGHIVVMPPEETGGYPVNIFPGGNNRWQCITNNELIFTDAQFRPLKRVVIGWTKSAAQLRDGSLLLCGGQKLSMLHETRLSVLYQFPHDKRIYAVAADDDGKLWMCTEQGLYTLHDTTIQYMGDKLPALAGRINDLRLDATGRLWIASAENGLLMLENEHLQIMTAPEEKISARNIFVDDDHVVYAGTDAGLIILKEMENGRFQITRFRKQDGLPSEKINALLVKDGMIWIATDEGLQIFPVNSKLKKIESVPIYLSSFTVNSMPVTIAPDLEFDSRQNNMQLSFSGISFREADAVTYRYKLRENDGGWQYTTNSTLDLPALPAGKYHVTVQAATTTDNWSKQPLQLTFTIQLPFWKTNLFYALIIFLFAASGVLLFRYRYTLKLQKEEQKRKSIEAELAALRSQMNPHFIFNSLNAIQDFIFQHKTEEANEYLAKFAKLIRAVLQQSRKKTVTVDEECELLKTYLELESLRFNHSFDWEIITGSEMDTDELMIPSMLLQPVVENSIRHGFKNLQRKGKLSIRFKKEGDDICCEITDNGTGRVTEKNGKGSSLAMSIIEERIKILNQSLQWPCTMEVFDLHDGGNPAGLKTVFRFPLSIGS